MTIWLPELRGRSGPKYRAIADAIVDAVDQGDLSPGDKLPPQRNLAYDLGVTLGTVTRAYQELERRGLARGEVGRGTFVADAGVAKAGLAETGDAVAISDAYAPGATELRVEALRRIDMEHTPVDELYGPEVHSRDGFELASNYPLTAGVGPLTARAVARVNHGPIWEAVCRYQARNGLQPHREAGAQWLADLGIKADADDLLIAPGAQVGTLTALMAFTQPGDVILTEALTWPGLKATATPLGLSIQSVAMDEDGIIPDALEKACREQAPRLLYLLPTLHNPTAGVMPEERRRKIAEIARRHGLFIIEDDVYGFLVEDAPPPVRAFAPEITVYVTSLSKAVSPGLRVGYVIVPRGRMNAFVGAMRSSVLMAAPVAVEIASEMIRGGEAAEMVAAQRAEIAVRQEMLAKRLGNLGVRTHPRSLHCWLPVPEAYTGPEFRTRLLENGVSVTPGNVFVMDDAHRPERHHVRLCLGPEQDRARLERALDIIADLARQRDPAECCYL